MFPAIIIFVGWRSNFFFFKRKTIILLILGASSLDQTSMTRLDNSSFGLVGDLYGTGLDNYWNMKDWNGGEKHWLAPLIIYKCQLGNEVRRYWVACDLLPLPMAYSHFRWRLSLIMVRYGISFQVKVWLRAFDNSFFLSCFFFFILKRAPK